MVKKTVFFRCDGTQQMGYGRIYRCLSIAESMLSQQCEVTICFVMRADSHAEEIVKSHNFFIKIIDATMEQNWMVDWRNDNSADSAIIFFDVYASEADEKTFVACREAFFGVVVLDDYHERRLEADAAFYYPLPQAQNLLWKDSLCSVYKGWEWIVINNILKSCCKNMDDEKEEKCDKKNRMLVIMNDENDAAFLYDATEVLCAFEGVGCGKVNWDVDIFLNYNSNEENIREMIGMRSNFYIHSATENIFRFMKNADLALTSFGITAWELTYMKVPSVLFCYSEEDALAATSLVYKGVSCSIGYIQDKEKRCRCAENILQMLLGSNLMLRNMSDKATGLIDGLGNERIACFLNA